MKCSDIIKNLFHLESKRPFQKHKKKDPKLYNFGSAVYFKENLILLLF
jgi:hypothetical protein